MLQVPALQVEIANPYPVSRTFTLHTDRPDLLSVRSPALVYSFLASLLRCELHRLPPRLRTTARASVHPSRESSQPSPLTLLPAG